MLCTHFRISSTVAVPVSSMVSRPVASSARPRSRYLAARFKATAVSPSSPAASLPPIRSSLHATGQLEANNQSTEYLPFSSIPALPSYPVVGSLFALNAHDPSKAKNQYHLAQRAIHDKYGPLVRVQMPGAAQPDLWIADPNMVAETFQNETKYPARPPLAAWLYYRQQHKQPIGIVNTSGEEWRRARMAAQGLIFNPQKAQKAFIKCVNPPTRLAMVRLEEHLGAQGDLALQGKQTVDVENVVMRWSIEAVSNVLLGRALGALDNPPIPIAQRMIDSFLVMMRTFGPIMRTPEWVWKLRLTKAARQHLGALEEIHHVCDELIQGELKALAQLPPEELEGTFLGHVMARSDALSPTEVMVMTADFLQAGIDTTSRTALNMMYYLSRYPNVQAKLRSEIVSVVGINGDVEVDHYAKLKYFKNVLKETFRIVPNFPQNGRTLTQDAVLGGYLIPAGTTLALNHYVMSHDPKLVVNPGQFIPERWETKDVHSAIVLPFGSGARRCIGSHVAEIELHVFIAHLLRRFEVIATPEEMELETTTGITPVGCTPLRLRPIQL